MIEKIENQKNKILRKNFKANSQLAFSKLTPAESQYLEIKIGLSQLLKQKRKERKFSQIDLANHIKSSQSRVAKMEKADDSVSLDLIIKALLSLGISRRELAKTISKQIIMFVNN